MYLSFTNEAGVGEDRLINEEEANHRGKFNSSRTEE